MKYKNLNSYEQPLEETWHPFALQQQQEGPGDNPQQQETKDDDDLDPFKGIVLDNVDDTVRAAITKARESVATLAKTNKEIAEQTEKVKKVAAGYQSKADKAEALLKKHNLTEDHVINKPVNPQDAIAAELEKEYLALGLAPEQCKSLAKINAVTVNLTRTSTLREVGSALGPMLGKLQSINADRFLDTDDPEAKLALQVPGVKESAQGIINEMIKANMDVSPDAVLSAIQTSLGQALMKAGGDMSKLKAAPVKEEPPKLSPLQVLLGGNGGGGGNHVHTSGTGDSLKHSTNEHTLSAGATIAKMMDRHIKK